MGSLLLGTQLKLQNTLHLTMALIKSKLFPEKKLQLDIENDELLQLGYYLIFYTYEKRFIFACSCLSTFLLFQPDHSNEALYMKE